jgi:hypothetical protein
MSALSTHWSAELQEAFALFLEEQHMNCDEKRVSIEAESARSPGRD